MSSASTAGKANPGVIGLFAYGMTVIMLCLNYIGAIPFSMGIFAMILIFGGIGEFIAGMMCFRNHDTFGATDFTAYGLFWWSLAVILCNPFGEAIVPADSTTLGFYLLLWAIFTILLFFGAWKQGVVSRIIFFTLFLLFLLLAVGNFTGAVIITTIAGYIGIISGAVSIYCAASTVIKEERQKAALEA
jgi:succinate-acetate transporter protein